ncbi:MAG: ATP-binding cassette domain-containing protein [Cyclobacteriaceae bacterium]
MLHIINFRKSYGDISVLAIDELRITPGLYWINGINGSGKSTFLKTLAGILSFDGDITLDESISLKKQSVAYRRFINFAEAEPLFPEFLTGWEMINLFTSAKGAPAGQEQYYIESMQMQRYLHQPIRTYSSGMLKKLSLVLAFIGQPRVILLDEPLITMDKDSLEILYQWISEKHEQEGTCFLLSSHQALADDRLSNARELLVAGQTVSFPD